jgi:hypothetical protein
LQHHGIEVLCIELKQSEVCCTALLLCFNLSLRISPLARFFGLQAAGAALAKLAKAEKVSSAGLALLSAPQAAEAQQEAAKRLAAGKGAAAAGAASEARCHIQPFHRGFTQRDGGLDSSGC